MKESMKHVHESGFSLFETVVTVAIVGGLIITGTYFAKDVLGFKLFLSERLSVDQSIEQTLQIMIPEIRSMGQSNTGSYPIKEAGANTLTFYSDIDRDGFFEEVKYFVSGNTFQKSIIKPTGNPPSYEIGNAILSDMVYSIATGTSVFAYFDENYAGTGNPLSLPVDVFLVRVIRIILTADEGGSESGSVTFSREITPRNIRTNL